MCQFDWNDDSVSPLTTLDRVARKPHKCVECARVIDPGERYRFETVLFDGKIWTYKTCAHCMAVRDWLTKQCGGFLYEGVKEDFLEHEYEQPGRSVLRAIVAMDRYQWRMNGNLMPVPNLVKHEEASNAS
jgi:hypothetical protein